jgi:group I intron endonuclease
MRKTQNFCTIYIITNSVNDKVYIGQTWQTINQRFDGHKEHALTREGGCIKLYNAMRAHGVDSFSIEPLMKCINQKMANFFEDLFIVTFDAIETGYNIIRGGSKGRHTQETKDKLSKMFKGKVVSAETRKKMSDIAKTWPKEKNPMYGKHHTDETKAKIRKKTTEREFDPAWQEKKKVFGVKHSQSVIGEKNSNAKLTWDDVKEIRSLFDSGKMNITELLNKYNVASISGILRNKNWIDPNYIPTLPIDKEEIRLNVIKINSGENNPNNKLTWDIVHQMRELYKAGERKSSLAERFNCSMKTVYNITHNKSWIE